MVSNEDYLYSARTSRDVDLITLPIAVYILRI